jgi:hypothetical protein
MKHFDLFQFLQVDQCCYFGYLWDEIDVDDVGGGDDGR